MWLRILKTSLVFALIYLLLAYTLLITIIVRNELQILDATKIVLAVGSAQEQATLRAQVRNVFGDPVPYAVILLENRLVQADNAGHFELSNLQPGHYTLEILAGEYEKFKREIQIEAGLNSPPFKYETGLWPQIFLTDFHVFYKQDGFLLGIIGFANGSDEPIFIQRAILFNPQGEQLADLLQHNGLSYYASLSNKLEIIEEPQRALKWAPRMWQSGEFPPIEGNHFSGAYTLQVHWGFQKEHESGQYRILTVSDHLDLDSDWSPHLP